MTTATVELTPLERARAKLNIVKIGDTVCGFCATNKCSLCPSGVRQGTHGVWVCPCQCNDSRGPKCLHCNTRHGDIDPERWMCVDQAQCEIRIRDRLAADPQYQHLQEVRRTANMVKVAEKAEKAEKVKAEKPKTYCLVTGKETKGGLFLPGMDARYVSLLVADVIEKGTAKAEADAKAKMNKDGVSDKLKAKFDKGLGLAREAVAKKAAAEAAKEAAKTAQAEQKAAKGNAKSQAATSQPATKAAARPPAKKAAAKA